MRVCWIGVWMMVGCGPMQPQEVSVPPTPWEQMGKRIIEAEGSALITLRFGCSGCTRFVANELIVYPDGRYEVFDLHERREKQRGRARAEIMERLRALLSSDRFRAVEDGRTELQSARPWLELRANGKPVRRHSPLREGHEPVLDEIMALLDQISVE